MLDSELQLTLQLTVCAVGVLAICYGIVLVLHRIRRDAPKSVQSVIDVATAPYRINSVLFHLEQELSRLYSEYQDDVKGWNQSGRLTVALELRASEYQADRTEAIARALRQIEAIDRIVRELKPGLVIALVEEFAEEFSSAGLLDTRRLSQ